MTPAEAKVAQSATSPVATVPEVMKGKPIPAKIEGIEIETEEQKENVRSRSPLAQLLHALNQPLTGLQCSMEVALAVPRSNEDYLRGLHEGLELTERMRGLVEAIREVADGLEEGQQNRETPETVELKAVLGGVMDELAPVAEAKGVSLVVIGSTAAQVMIEGRVLTGLLFRLLESVLSLAAQGTSMRIETVSEEEGAPGAVSIRLHWQGEETQFAGSRAEPFSRAELGLLVAQAACEQNGGQWERARTGEIESVTLRLAASGPKKS